MIQAWIKIGDGEVYDTYQAYGFTYMSSSNRLGAPTKGFAVSTYPEQAGENVDPRTVDDAFDYEVKFLVEAPNKDLVNANAKISDFNSQLYDLESTGSHVKVFKPVTFYNRYKRVIVTGYPQPIDEADEDDFFRDKYGYVHDAVVVKFKIRVNDPTQCNFSITDKDIPPMAARPKIILDEGGCILTETDTL